MTVADLIAELQQHPPQKQVRVLIATVVVLEDGLGEQIISIPRHCAREADDVRNEGAYVLIESR